MSEHEPEEWQERQHVVAPVQANWRFSFWDIAGITITWVGSLFGVTSQALHLLAQECAASANFSRDLYDEERARRAFEDQQREAAQELERLLGGPVDES